MGIWGGIILFLTLVIPLFISGIGVIATFVEIERSSGWTAFGYSMLLLFLIGLMLLLIWIGGDQLSLGYHMYG